jgi:hypothetical protein
VKSSSTPSDLFRRKNPLELRSRSNPNPLYELLIQGIYLFLGIYVKLFRLLLELSAAAEAKQRGLKSLPYGRWADKSGKIVARTVDGKLVRVVGDEPESKEPKSSEPKAKPTGTSAKAAGTAKSNIPTKLDQDKKMGTLEPKKDGKGKSSEEPQINPEPTYPVTYQTKMTIGKPVEKDRLPELIGAIDKFGHAEEIVIGEEIHIVDQKDFDAFLDADEETCGLLAWDGVHEHARISAFKQAKEWREKLPHKMQIELRDTAEEWQDEGPMRMSASARQRVNAVFDKVSKMGTPVCNVAQPIERGMILSPANLKDFLSGVRVGEDINLPNSGFSSDAQVARKFASGKQFGTDAFQHGAVGVLIRLLPNKDGNVHGIHLTGLTDITQEESEIVRPSWAKQRCVGVKKLLAPRPDWPDKPHTACVYVLDLQEVTDEPKTVEEGFEYDWTKKPTSETFDMYMNTSVMNPPSDNDPDTSLSSMVPEGCI